jgi:hypothetical protein
MKTVELVCHHCSGKYKAFRCSSKYCSKRCRTAAWRARVKADVKFQIIHLHNGREGSQMITIRRELTRILGCTLEYDKAGIMPLSTIKILREQLNQTINAWMNLKRTTLAEQIEWIYNYVDGFLFLLIHESEKVRINNCNFSLETKVRIGIERLIGLRK